jgi:hypothetical protein
VPLQESVLRRRRRVATTAANRTRCASGSGRAPWIWRCCPEELNRERAAAAAKDGLRATGDPSTVLLPRGTECCGQRSCCSPRILSAALAAARACQYLGPWMRLRRTAAALLHAGGLLNRPSAVPVAAALTATTAAVLAAAEIEPCREPRQTDDHFPDGLTANAGPARRQPAHRAERCVKEGRNSSSRAHCLCTTSF